MDRSESVINLERYDWNSFLKEKTKPKLKQKPPKTNETDNLNSNLLDPQLSRNSKTKINKILLTNSMTASRYSYAHNPNWEITKLIQQFKNESRTHPKSNKNLKYYDDQPITVCVRKRPLSRKEIISKEIDIISIINANSLTVHNPKTRIDLTKFLDNHSFSFDYVFSDACSNDIVYENAVKPLIDTVLYGGLATCFAYGQSGSGKTHTIIGEYINDTSNQQDYFTGLCAMAFNDIFKHRNMKNFYIFISFFEIYNEIIYDLLRNRKKRPMFEDDDKRIKIIGLTEKPVFDIEQVVEIIEFGNKLRTVGYTSINNNSSKSHAVFQIILKRPASKEIYGKYSFIDLANIDEQNDYAKINKDMKKDQQMEPNKTTMILQELLRVFNKKYDYSPKSKLIQIIKESLQNKRNNTCMITMIQPGLGSCKNTLNLLKYSKLFKNILESNKTNETKPIETKKIGDNLEQLNKNSKNICNFKSACEKLAGMKNCGDGRAIYYKYVNDVFKREERARAQKYKLAISESQVCSKLKQKELQKSSNKKNSVKGTLSSPNI